MPISTTPPEKTPPATDGEGGDLTPPGDLTALLVTGAERDPRDVLRTIAAGPYGEVWVRVHPLAAAGLTQIEVLDGNGQPRVDPQLVQALSTEARAAFVHGNRGAGQALLHAFEKGQELEGWVGAPGELDGRVQALLGKGLREILAADDGSRAHPFFAASDTVGLARGRAFRAPQGMPLGLGSLGFHDRGFAPVGEERVALVAFDPRAIEHAFTRVPGRELSVRIDALPDRVFGPLAPLKPAVVAELLALGDATPQAANLRSVHALELLLLADSYVFAGGDAVPFVDGRLLPLFSLTTGDPPLDDADEAEALEAKESVLAAMVEVIPYTSPEGSLLEQLGDEEVRPLAPWAQPGEEYVGSIFQLDSRRLRGLLAGLDQRDLAARIDRFYRAWWKAQTDDPLDAEFEAWKRALDEKGAADVNRVLTQWAEWRVVCEVAAENGFGTALLFYG